MLSNFHTSFTGSWEVCLKAVFWGRLILLFSNTGDDGFLHSSRLRHFIENNNNVLSLTWIKARNQGPGNGGRDVSTHKSTPGQVWFPVLTSQWEATGLKVEGDVSKWSVFGKEQMCLIVTPRHSHNQLLGCLHKNWSCLSAFQGSIPRISDPFPSISAHRVYLLRPQKDMALSGLLPGSQTGGWFYFLIPRNRMGYLEILSKCS